MVAAATLYFTYVSSGQCTTYLLVLQLAAINETFRVLIRSMTMIAYDDTINLETKDADLRKTKRGQFWSAMLLAIS